MKYQVLIPVKNGMPYVAEAIYSVLRSKGLKGIDLEIHISDAGSTDSTISFLESLSDYQQIYVHFQRGLSREENWNKVSSYADGDFVRLLCADDRVSETSIARSIELLCDDKDISLVAGTRNLIDYKGRVLWKEFGSKRLKALTKLSGQDVLREFVRSGTNLLGEPSNVTFRTKTFKQHLPWSDKFPYCLDLSVYVKVLQESYVLMDSQLHSDFRVHEQSLSNRIMLNQARQFADFLNYLNSSHIVRISKLQLFQSFVRAILINFARVAFHVVFVKLKNVKSGRSKK